MKKIALLMICFLLVSSSVSAGWEEAFDKKMFDLELLFVAGLAQDDAGGDKENNFYSLRTAWRGWGTDINLAYVKPIRLDFGPVLYLNYNTGEKDIANGSIDWSGPEYALGINAKAKNQDFTFETDIGLINTVTETNNPAASETVEQSDDAFFGRAYYSEYRKDPFFPEYGADFYFKKSFDRQVDRSVNGVSADRAGYYDVDVIQAGIYARIYDFWLKGYKVSPFTKFTYGEEDGQTGEENFWMVELASLIGPPDQDDRYKIFIRYKDRYDTIYGGFKIEIF